MHNQKWDISDAQSSTDLHGCLVLDAVASTLDARASTADGLDAAASTHGLDAWPRRLDASGAWSHSTPPLDTSTLARRYSLDVCSTLGSTQARRLDARAQVCLSSVFAKFRGRHPNIFHVPSRGVS